MARSLMHVIKQMPLKTGIWWKIVSNCKTVPNEPFSSFFFRFNPWCRHNVFLFQGQIQDFHLGGGGVQHISAEGGNRAGEKDGAGKKYGSGREAAPSPCIRQCISSIKSILYYCILFFVKPPGGNYLLGGVQVWLATTTVQLCRSGDEDFVSPERELTLMDRLFLSHNSQ